MTRSLDIAPFTRRNQPVTADEADPFLSEGAL